jgi:hypothetical protein
MFKFNTEKNAVKFAERNPRPVALLAETPEGPFYVCRPRDIGKAEDKGLVFLCYV